MKRLEKWLPVVRALPGLWGLKRYGFRQGSQYDVWINKREKVVIKRSLICGRRPKFRTVPTIRVSTRYANVILVQALCKIPRSEWGRHRLIDIITRDHPYSHFMDLHSSNVGMYRNKAVMFDW